MQLRLITLIISSLAAIRADSEDCVESRRLESECGQFCFKIVKPVLTHTHDLQEQIDSVHKKQNSEHLNMLKEIKSRLDEKFDIIEKRMRELTENQKIIAERIYAFEMTFFTKINSKYYYIDHDKKLNWFDAVEKCKALGGHLPSLQSQTELDALAPHLKQKFYWVDINDIANEGVYISQTTRLRAPFVNWYPGEPNNCNGENCVQVRTVDGVYTMNDDNCNSLIYYICEREDK